MDIDWQEVGKGAIVVGLVGYLLVDGLRRTFPKAPKKADAVATKLGLQYKRNVWKAESWWEGTWEKHAVRAHILPTDTPSIEVGTPPGKDARWMAMDRKVEDLLVPLKGEPTPVPTGDRRFDERFNLRVYETGSLSAITAPMRSLLLEAGPESVTMGPEGLEYIFGEDVTGPKLRRHLDAATTLARLAGHRPGYVPTAEASA